MHSNAWLVNIHTCADSRCFNWLTLPAEGDLYFTVKLQNYTAVEKDRVVLSCELSKAVAEVRWFKDTEEIFPSKNISFQSDGRKRMMVIKRAAKSSLGAYTCDCGTDKTTANLNIEGNTCGSQPLPLSPLRQQAPPTSVHLCFGPLSTVHD